MKFTIKNIGTTALAMLVTLWVVALSGCGGDDPPTKAEKVTKMLTAKGDTWSSSGNSSVTIDGVEVGDELFADFSITFTDNAFTTTGTSPVWLRQDTWSFKDKSADVIIRGQDGKEVTITSISATELTLTLAWDETTYAGGRKRSLAGTHTFVLSK